MGFPTKNDHFEVFLGYHHLRKTPNRCYCWVGLMNSCQGWRYSPYCPFGADLGCSELKKNLAKVEDQKTTSQKTMSYVGGENDHQFHKSKDWWCYTFTLKETETDVINFQVNDSRIFFGWTPLWIHPPQSQLTKISMSSATHRRAMIAYMAGVMFLFPWIMDPTGCFQK